MQKPPLWVEKLSDCPLVYSLLLNLLKLPASIKYLCDVVLSLMTLMLYLASTTQYRKVTWENVSSLKEIKSKRALRMQFHLRRFVKQLGRKLARVAAKQHLVLALAAIGP